MNANDNHLLFEMYKLHCELAERVSSLRESSNKIYLSIIASIITASVLLYRFVPDSGTIWVLPILGILVSISWMFTLHSITGRLYAKHNVLMSLEEQLPFKFLGLENEEFNKSRVIRRKYTGLVMPGAFLVLCVAWLVYLSAWCTHS